jgi:hypothetical protein
VAEKGRVGRFVGRGARDAGRERWGETTKQKKDPERTHIRTYLVHVLALHAVEEDREPAATAAVLLAAQGRGDGEAQRRGLGDERGPGQHLPLEHAVDEAGIAALLEALLIEEAGGDLDDGLCIVWMCE